MKKISSETDISVFSLEKWQKCAEHLTKIDVEYYFDGVISGDAMDTFIIDILNDASDDDSYYNNSKTISAAIRLL